MSKVNTPSVPQQSYTVIGLMSGTSLDGVDAALLSTDGQRAVEAGQHYFRPYTADERALLVQTMQQAVQWNFKGPPPNIFARAEAMIDSAHKEAVTALMRDAKMTANDIDLIGYHGQTVLHHAPNIDAKGQTLQIGNGQRLADAFGIPTVYDFRSADVVAGGQGAPLAPIYHQALVRAAGLTGTIAVINIGGVSNVTLVGPNDMLLASDCGPGNGPLDSWIAQHGFGDYDKDGALSLAGTPDIARLEGWLKRPFFKQTVPKSADRYDFDVLSSMHGMSAENGAATLSAFCAVAISNTLRQYAQVMDNIIICGGGRHNPAIMAALREELHSDILKSDDFGWDGDALEAQAFAYMAARHVKRLPLSFPSTTSVSKSVTGGIMAQPRKS